MSAAQLDIEFRLPDGRKLSVRRTLSQPELDEFMVSPGQPPGSFAAESPSSAHYALMRWQEQRERSRSMCRNLAETVTFALQNALLEDKATP